MSGTGSYKEGDEVTLIAEGKNGYEFVEWTNAKGIEMDNETEPEISFEMPANKVSIKANFRKIPMYRVSISKNGAGTVYGAGSYEKDDEVIINAEAADGYTFVEWSDIEGIEIDDVTEPEVIFEMPENKVSMKANFEKIQSYEVSISKTSGGSVDGFGIYESGEWVTISAEPDDGYKFDGWTNIKGISVDKITSSEITFIMPKNDVSITAKFEKVNDKLIEA